MRSIVEFLKSRGSELSAEQEPTPERPLGEGKVVTLQDRRNTTSHTPSETPDDTDPGPAAA